MNIAKSFLSLRAKLFALVFFSVVLIATPTIILTSLSIYRVSGDFEKKSFENALLLLDDNISSRYLNLLSGQVLDVLERKILLQTTAILTQTTWNEISSFSKQKRLTFINNWVQSLENLNNHLVIISNEKPITNSYLFEVLSIDKNRKDFKEQEFAQMLNSNNLPAEGMHAVFTITEKDLQDTSIVYRGIGNLEPILNKALEDNKKISVLVYLLPLDEQTVVVASSVLNDIEQSAKENLTTIISSLQEKFENLEFYPKSILALITGNGELIAKRGEITQELIPYLPEEAFLNAKSNKQSEFIYDESDQSLKDNPFFKNFGASILRMTYFKALDWYVLAGAPIFEVEEAARGLFIRLILIAAFCIVLSVLVTLVMAYRIANPLRLLTNKAQTFANKDLTIPITIDNYSELSESLNSMTQNLPTTRLDEVGQLATAFNQMGIALENNINSLIKSKADAERIQGELDAARDIQIGILPGPEIALPHSDFEISYFLEPAKEVGGDLYDYFETSEGKKAVIIGDVSGKGVAAALFMAMTVTTVRYAILSGLAPHIAMEYVNNSLSKNNSNCMFVTLFIGIFDSETGILEYANGGHCFPYILKNNGEISLFDHSSGLVVGPMEDMPYTLGKGHLEHGETCFLYTDGISEAMNEQHKIFGEHRIEEILKNCHNQSPKKINDLIYQGIIDYRGNAEPSDDITMLCFKRI